MVQSFCNSLSLYLFRVRDSLLDSVSALDMTAYLDRATGLYVLSLGNCELADGATAMNLFKGIRNNKSLLTLKLRGVSLNVQALKVGCTRSPRLFSEC